MHVNGTNIRYCKIPHFRNYEINCFSEVRTVADKQVIPQIVNDTGEDFWLELVNDFGDTVKIRTARIMLLTFIGELELPIVYKDENKKWDNTISNIRYDIPEYFKMECKISDEVRLSGIRFRRIPRLPKYFISETGIVYGTRNKQFNSISFDKDGYRFASFFDETNKKKPYRISRLVFETFEHPIQEGYVIDHFVSDKNMNNIGNLTEMSVKDNNIKAYQMDGKVISHSKDDVKKILKMKSEGLSCKEIAFNMGLPLNNGANIIRCLIHSIYSGVAHNELL